MQIDGSAPAVGHAETDVSAPADVVWNVLADIDRWPTWNSSITSARLEGGLVPGSTFRWKAGPGSITSTLRNVDPPRELGWTGRTFGIDAVHVYRLEARGDGTHVTSEESWDGLPVRLMRRRMRRTLQQALDDGLLLLKAEAERRVAEPPGGGSATTSY